MNAADLISKREPLPSPVVDLDTHLFDASRFPLVRLRRRAIKPGYAFAWCAQMRRLLALGTPFVIVAQYDGSETPDDAHLRRAWLRTQRVQLAAYCRGMIVIEPRIEARATTREAVRQSTEGSGVRTVVVSSMRVAGELAPVLLKHTGEAAAPVSKSRAV